LGSRWHNLTSSNTFKDMILTFLKVDFTRMESDVLDNTE
jgi:hypothetical protein